CLLAFLLSIMHVMTCGHDDFTGAVLFLPLHPDVEKPPQCVLTGSGKTACEPTPPKAHVAECARQTGPCPPPQAGPPRIDATPGTQGNAGK
ncbi:MAG: hypothetical protein PHI96_07985, partial [Desulfovibrio sp.]|nr:hypothetical protein [Desulfovibrio sp.]